MYALLTDKKGRVRFSGIRAPDYAADSDGLLLLTLYGVPQATRAVWAHIVKGRKTRTLTATQVRLNIGRRSEKVCVTPNLYRYHSHRLAGEGLLILRQDFNRLHHLYILGGTTEIPSPHFAGALKNVPRLPYRPKWLPAMWVAGLADKMIMAPRTCETDIGVWRIGRHEESWQRIVAKLLKEGVIA